MRNKIIFIFFPKPRTLGHCRDTIRYIAIRLKNGTLSTPTTNPSKNQAFLPRQSFSRLEQLDDSILDFW
jgi:hypothetical protein